MRRRVLLSRPNEKEISHGRVSWQASLSCFAGGPSASSNYWSSSSYSWRSGTDLEMRRSEAVNNSAAVERIMVDKLMKLLVELVLGKRARTGPLRMFIDDRSTIVTILSSGAGRAFIRNESSDEEPVRGLATIMPSPNESQACSLLPQQKKAK